MIDLNFYQKKTDSITLDNLIKNFNLSPFYPRKEKNNNIKITGINNLQNAKSDELCFITNIKYLPKLKSTSAKICLIEEDFHKQAQDLNLDIIFLTSKKAHHSFSEILNFFYQEFPPLKRESNISKNAKIAKNTYIDPSAIIEDGVVIGENCQILAGSFIGRNCKIGNDCKIAQNTVITYSKISNNVEISNNCSIGQDGFGFAFNGKGFDKIIQLGLVLIEDNVSIGANVAIDRGSMSNTVIGQGTKIDNLVQIAHNIEIGQNSLIASQTGFAGSTKVGDFVVFGGQVGVSGHIKIGSHNRFAAKSGITKNISDSQGDFAGFPAKPKKDWQKEQIAIKNLTKNK